MQYSRSGQGILLPGVTGELVLPLFSWMPTRRTEEGASGVVDDLAAGDGGQGAVGVRRHPLADEPHAAVAEQEVAAAPVGTAEAAGGVVRPGRRAAVGAAAV